MRTVRQNDGAPGDMLNPSSVIELSVDHYDADVALAALQSVVRAVKV